MPQVSTQLLFEKCYSRFAIAAVNVFTMEQVHGLFSAANVSKTPIIVQITPVARDYVHPLMLRKMIEAAAVIYKEVIFFVHLDHGVEKLPYPPINRTIFSKRFATDCSFKVSRLPD